MSINIYTHLLIHSLTHSQIYIYLFNDFTLHIIIDSKINKNKIKFTVATIYHAVWARVQYYTGWLVPNNYSLVIKLAVKCGVLLRMPDK